MLFDSGRNSLTIFSRLMLGNFAILAIAAGISASAVLQFGNMNAAIHSIMLVNNDLAELNNQMTSALLSETRYERKFALLHDNTLYKGFTDSVEDFEKSLNRALLLADSDSMKKSLHRLEKLNYSYRELFMKEIGFVKRGDHLRGKRYWREKERLVTEAMEELAYMKALNQQNILQKIGSLEESAARGRANVIAVAGIALLAGVIFSFAITRSITRPLLRIKKKTGEIARGVFEADPDLPSPPEIRELALAFNTMCLKLGEVDRMKSDFYSLMSHELRTPLTSIMEGTNLLLEGVVGEIAEKQRELLVIIAEESSRLIEMASRLLDLSKLESGIVTFNISICDLAPLATRAIREMAPLAAAREIIIESDMEDVPSVPADPERVMQALRNLIANALKFTPEKGKVHVSLRRRESSVEVSVEDNGPGIPEEELDTVFEKFRQTSIVSSGKFAGTGLGLAIVRHIVQAHGGKVWVESVLGRGAVFTFALPF